MIPERDMALIEKVSKLEQDMIHTNLGMKMIVERVEQELMDMKQAFDHIKREEKLIRKRLTLLEEEKDAGKYSKNYSPAISRHLHNTHKRIEYNRID